MRGDREVEVWPNTRPLVEKKKDVVRDATFGDEVDIEDNHNKTKEPQEDRPSPIWEYQPKIPYPTRLRNDKEDTQFKKFMEVLK